MDARLRATTNRHYEDFEPGSDWVREEQVDTFLIYLSDFKKEHLRVQLTPARVLKISGERPLGDNRWKRFLKEIKVPSNCETKEISAKFEGGILYVKMPKVIAPHPPQPTTQPPEPVTPPPKPTPTEAPPPPPGTTATAPVPVPATATGPAHQEAEFEKESSNEAVKPEKDNREEPSKGQPDEGKRKEEEASQAEEMTKKRWAMKRQGGEGSSNFFKELRKPENLKKLIATVLLMLVLALHLAYVKRTCTRMQSLETGLVEME